MEKIHVQVGDYDSSLKNVFFTGELVTTYQEFEIPDKESQGTRYDLYRVKKGYRVFEKRWTNGQGQDRQNYAKLSDVLTESELLEKYASIANYAGIFETLDLDTRKKVRESEKTVLLAVSGNSARLLPYNLANVEELINLGHFLVDQEDVPNEIKAEFKSAIEDMED